MNNFDRTDKIEAVFVIDVTSGDVEISQNNTDERFPCRAILSDTGGEIKVRMFSHLDGKSRDVILSLPAQVWMQYGNITKVYRYLTGTTNPTSQVLNDSNTYVNGIKLGR